MINEDSTISYPPELQGQHYTHENDATLRQKLYKVRLDKKIAESSNITVLQEGQV